MRAVTAAALAALALLPASMATPAAGRPFTIDDLLGQGSFGEVALSPGGRWLVFEQRGRYDRLPRYDVGYSPSTAFADLFAVDLRHPGPARPLLPRAGDEGLFLGPSSPSGAQLVVYRRRGLRWDFGVVDVASGGVRWFDLAPEAAGSGRSVQWRGEHQLLVIARPDHAPPPDLRQGPTITARLAGWWAGAARGEAAVTVVGSGAYAPVRPQASLRRLVRVDLTRGTETPLAEGAFFDLELSPDGRRLVLLESGPDVQPRGDGPVRGLAGLETEASRLTILDLATGVQASPCAVCDVLPRLLAWSPDSRSLLAFARGPSGTWRDGRLLRIAAESGAVAEVGAGVTPEFEVNPVVVRAGWMGEDPVLYGRAADAKRANWYRLGVEGPVNLTAALPAPDRRLRAGDGEALVLLAADRLWRVDRRGRAEVLSPAEARPALRDRAGLPTARLTNLVPEGSWIRLGTGSKVRVAWVETKGLGPAAPRGDAPGQLLAADGRAGALVCAASDGHGIETLSVVRRQGPPVAVATLNAGLADTDVMRIEPVRHRGAQGERLTSWLYLPALAPGAPPPPLIVRPYLGDSYQTPPRTLKMEDGFFGNLRLLTGHGYAVLVPSLPNPPGGMTEPMAGLADRILSVERAAREDPRLAGLFDPDREALLGWSFGGYTVMATITETDHFRAAVALDGISDLVAYWSHISLGHAVSPEDGYGSNWATGTVEATQPQLGGPPWSNLARYTRNSPLLFADRIKTPLLLIHGWRDSVPYGGSEAMFSALFRQSKDAELVTYWAAEHRVVSPGDVRDAWARTFAFLDGYLTPGSSPAAAGPVAHPEPGLANGAPTLPPPPH
jgi:dipeptidyl aminopeptidase/acylaminoacyl peptidase